MRRKFNGPYYNWSCTPHHVRELMFETFAGKYNWEIGITSLVRDNFFAIASRRMRGIVSQARRGPGRPTWINEKLWEQMQLYWATPEAQEKSVTASNCRRSTRGGLGIAKHNSGQKSFLRRQQEMEAELGRPVSWGEVFLRTHTNKDGTFVDCKSQQVAEAYEKQLAEAVSDGDADASAISELSTQRTLSIDQKNDIFLKCTLTDNKGTIFGLGDLPRMQRKRKRTQSYASSSVPQLSEMQEKLEAAQRKLDAQDADNARRDEEQRKRDEEQRKRDEEHRKGQEQLAEMTKLLTFFKTSDPRIAAYMTSDQPTTSGDEPPIPPTQS